MDRELLLHVVGFRAFIFDVYYFELFQVEPSPKGTLSVQLQYSWEIKVLLVRTCKYIKVT